MTDCNETMLLLDSSLDPPLRTGTSTHRYKHHSAQYIILSISAIILILDISSCVAVVPQTVILEDIVCSKYYSSLVYATSGTKFDGDRCKIEPVQSEVALVNGWKDTFEAIPGILLSIPYGALADQIGRKKILLLAMIGCLLGDVWARVICWFTSGFPLRAIWFSSIWQIIGGGAATFTPLLFVMVADVCPPEKRTTAFSQIQGAVLLSELLSVPAGAGLMSISPWVPYLGSSAIMVLGICLAVLLIPETFPTTKRIQSQDQNDHATTPLLQDPQDDLAPSPGNPHKESYKLAEAGPWIKRNVAVILIISCFFVSELGKQVAGVLLQYTSKKFHWNYAKASYLISLRAGVNLLVLTVIIPTLSGLFLGRLKMSPALKDKRLTQISGVLLVTGCMTIFLAVSPPILILGQVVFALGFAFSVTARSLVTSLVEQKLLGTIYTSISVLTYSGILVGGPLLASSFQWGMQLREEFWMGMPFVVAAGLFMLALIAVSAVNLHSRKDSGT